MKLPLRLEAALLKLYTAFNNDQLHPEDACRCAVGNILDQKDFWKNFSDEHGSPRLNYVGQFHEALGRKFNGYTPAELLKIEVAFLMGCGYKLPLCHKTKSQIDPTHPNVLFKGLDQAINLLCELEGMDTVIGLTLAFDDIRVKKENRLLVV